MLTGGAVCLVSFNRPCSGQTTDTGAEVQTVPAFDTENFTLRRFIAVHGRQALIDGYSTGGLEVWAHGRLPWGSALVVRRRRSRRRRRPI